MSDQPERRRVWMAIGFIETEGPVGLPAGAGVCEINWDPTASMDDQMRMYGKPAARTLLEYLNHKEQKAVTPKPRESNRVADMDDQA